MTDLKQELQRAVTYWRAAAIQADLAALEISNRFTQGHLCGMSNALTSAANRIEALLAELAPAPNKSELDISRQRYHAKQPTLLNTH